MAAKAKMPVQPTVVPAGALGPKQPKAVQGYMHSLSWWADKEMDEEIVYEITRMIYEFADKFEEYAGSGSGTIESSGAPCAGEIR